MKALIFVMLFFIASALIIISNNDLSFYKGENVKTFSQLYFNWLDNVYSNVHAITGNVIKMDWFPTTEKQNP